MDSERRFGLGVILRMAIEAMALSLFLSQVFLWSAILGGYL